MDERTRLWCAVLAGCLAAAVLLFELTGCATNSPKPDPEKTLFAIEGALSTLEGQMTAYCESPVADSAVCADMKRADNDAYAAVSLARASMLAGNDPMQSLSHAAAAMDALRTEIELAADKGRK